MFLLSQLILMVLVFLHKFSGTSCQHWLNNMCQAITCPVKKLEYALANDESLHIVSIFLQIHRAQLPTFDLTSFLQIAFDTPFLRIFA